MLINPTIRKQYLGYKKANSDSYGKAVVDFTELFCEYLEKKIQELNFADIPPKYIINAYVKEAFKHANLHMNITGFQFSCFKWAVEKYWYYREDFSVLQLTLGDFV